LNLRSILGPGYTIFAVVPGEYQVGEFRHLASGTHDHRVCLITFVAAVIEVAATRHLEPAPFAFDGMKTADILSYPLFL
jgi:hypothetical protein